jgi:hypothetical protein
MVARGLPDRMGLPADPRLWSDDDVLHYLLDYGSNVPGDLVVGRTMLNEALTGPQPEPVPREKRSETYPGLVDKVQAGQVPGSSAGGEQPKFTTSISDDANGSISEVITKFSPRLDAPAGIRWADLLISEFNAGTLLRNSGIAVAQLELIFTSDRVFLESQRFDRVGAHGRRGLLSAESVAAAYMGRDGTWTEIASNLKDLGALSPVVAEDIRTLDWFGRFIANTDMHLGNLSFWFSNDTYPFLPAPAYDMLPMGYAPLAGGEIIERELILPVPLPEDREAVCTALPLARAFWSLTMDDERISASFKKSARTASSVLDNWALRFGF